MARANTGHRLILRPKEAMLGVVLSSKTLAVGVALTLTLVPAGCKKPAKTEARLGESFEVGRWDCTVLDTESFGKKLTTHSWTQTHADQAHVASTVPPTKPTNHFERLHVACTSRRFRSEASMAPTVLTMDDRNPSSTDAHLVFTDPRFGDDDYLDPNTTPSFHAKGRVQPGETREYWTIIEVPDSRRACVFASGPSFDPDYPRVIVTLDK